MESTDPLCCRKNNFEFDFVICDDPIIRVQAGNWRMNSQKASRKSGFSRFSRREKGTFAKSRLTAFREQNGLPEFEGRGLPE